MSAREKIAYLKGLLDGLALPRTKDWERFSGLLLRHLRRSLWTSRSRRR